MAKQYSARVPTSLPSLTDVKSMPDAIQTWKPKLNQAIKSALPPPTPYNFKATSMRGGIMLSWSPIPAVTNPKLTGPDGYELLRSPSGTFTDDIQIIPIPGVHQTSYLDNIGGSATTVSYRIRTTGGSAAAPQSQRGPESGTVRHRSIDASDTKTAQTTIFDNFTTDKTRSNARFGNYGSEKYKTGLGKVGGGAAGSGAGYAGGTGGGGSGVPPVIPGPPGPPGPPAGAVSFDQIQSGENTTAAMILGAGAVLDVDPNNPGVIDATNIQGIPVNPAAPTHNGELLIYDAPSGTYIPGDPLVQGVEAAGTQSTTNPVQIGGVDQAGRVQKLRVDADGGLPDVKETNRLLQLAAQADTSPQHVIVETILTEAHVIVDSLPPGGSSTSLTDGTNGTVAVKPGSTPAAASDIALVVAVSPNNTIPENQTQIAGAAIATAAAGVQKVGVVGSSGGVVDAVIGAGTAPANMVVTGGVRNTTPPAPTNGQSTALQLDSSSGLRVTTEGGKPTYASQFQVTSLANYTVVLIGSGTKTVKVTRVRLSVNIGAAALASVFLTLFTSVSGGTSASPAKIAYDSNDVAATAVLNTYTVTPSTQIGVNIEAWEGVATQTTTPSTTGSLVRVEWTFGGNGAKLPTLRGTAQGLGIFSSTAGLTLSGSFEWTEE